MVLRPIQQWNNSFLKFPAFFLTLPIVILMTCVVHCRLVMQRFFMISRRPDIPVIVIGSVFVGGSGKTPVTELIAGESRRRGVRTAVVSNGFRKKSKGEIIVSDGFRLCADVEDAGDEAFMMARRFLEAGQEIPVVSGSNRFNAISIINKNFQSELIIMDDGLQYGQMRAHAEVATFDFAQADKPFILLPWGQLRDSLSRIRNSHTVMITKIPEGRSPDESTLRRIKRISRSETVLDSYYIPCYLTEWFQNRRLDLQSLAGKKIVLFSGLANNFSFFEMAGAMTSRYRFQIQDRIEFNDHHWYTRHDCGRITGPYNADPSVIWLTTEKDAVKLKPEWFPGTACDRLWTLASQASVSGLREWMDSALPRLLNISDKSNTSSAGAHRV